MKDRISHLSRDISTFEEDHLNFNLIEIRSSVNIPIDKSIEGAFSNAFNEAQRLAYKNFMNVLNGFLLIMDRNIILGPQIYKGGPQEALGSFIFTGWELTNIPVQFVNIKKNDIPSIIKAIDLVSGKSTKEDQVIPRALDPFFTWKKAK